MPATAPSWTALAAALLDREVARSVAAGSLPSLPPSMTVFAAGAEGPDLLAAADRAVSAADAALEAVLTGGAAVDTGTDSSAGGPDAGDLDLDAGDPHPLAVIAATAELRPSEARLLSVIAAIEIRRDLQRLVAALCTDPTAARLTVDLACRMLGDGAASALAGDGRLIRAALIEVDGSAPWAAATVALPRRVAWALIGDDSADPALPSGTERLVRGTLTLGGPALVFVNGADRVRRVQAGAGSLGGFEYLLCPLPTSKAEWRAVVREATVTGAGLLLDCAAAGAAALDATARRYLERADHLAIAVLSSGRLPVECLPRRPFTEIDAAPAEVTDAEWSVVFPDEPAPARRPTAQQLHTAARIRNPGQTGSAVIHRVASGALLKHARRITPEATWADLILPTEQEARLRSLAERYRRRDTVHGAWGLPRYPSPGVVAMFAGPSGTGKSTAAEVIAGSLGLDLFRIDLSALVSKYIGETEKNLEEIFAAATAGDYVLLFDEADALFGARSKVTDARDRYANMEVSYLLQRLESYDGFVILTSNFQGNIDPAFLRRIHVAVPFAVPTAVDREQIWRRSLAGAPQDGLDIASVATRFDLTGGSIRMAALSAAYLAAERDTAIGMPELMEAIAAEMTKLRRRADTGLPAGS